MSSQDKRDSGLVQGTLDLLILRTLSLEPLHGYGIGLRLEQLSRGALRVNAGSLFPAFRQARPIRSFRHRPSTMPAPSRFARSSAAVA